MVAVKIKEFVFLDFCRAIVGITGATRPLKQGFIMAPDFILCADCGQETPMDRLSPAFGLCSVCDRKYQLRFVSWGKSIDSNSKKVVAMKKHFCRMDEKKKARLTYRILREKEKRPLPDHPRQGLLFPDFVSPFPERIDP